MLSQLKFRGPLTKLGLSIALIIFLIDQGHKWLMILGLGLKSGDVITLTPFLDVVMVWNKGISYGLFQQHSAIGRGVLLAIALVTCLILIIWLARTSHALVAFGLGFLIGGALGNALDRLIHGAVADFFSLHAFGFYWYVFNIADMAVVAGVALLLYDSIMRRDEA